ncbi:CoA pyrophosphatase [Mangrovivirga sp. M17]|uniref:CoA pyrophosphatase n=1 Tax=Mangrovivirga halotolerans TaxID=2993936 RepID=A0ABT3RLJ2_9BACT|nr:CoA pyrophosphatase [Mangrovivirga halotolerans]MCX2742383.1 CoA pyrophosphatase [Mangrovivirga halotolerans]
MEELNFESFIEKLERILKKPLPGRSAQLEMSARFDENLAEKYFNPGRDAKMGGVMVLFYPEDDGTISLPLMLRPEYPGVHSGQISLPGGKQEPGDKNLIETAIRETEEEIGVNSSDINILGNLSELFIFASNFLVIPSIGYLDYKPDFVPEEGEVEKIIPFPVKSLIDPETVKTTNIQAARGIRLHAPYFDVEGHIVWGATAMMLSELRTILKNL